MSKKQRTQTLEETPESVLAEQAADEVLEDETQEPKDQQPPEDETPEKPRQAIAADTPCPFKATIDVALAVLRKNIGIGTSEMLKPVATLPQGTAVTITEIQDGYCRLQNGLWVAAESIAI